VQLIYVYHLSVFFGLVYVFVLSILSVCVVLLVLLRELKGMNESCKFVYDNSDITVCTSLQLLQCKAYATLSVRLM